MCQNNRKQVPPHFLLIQKHMHTLGEGAALGKIRSYCTCFSNTRFCHLFVVTVPSLDTDITPRPPQWSHGPRAVGAAQLTPFPPDEYAERRQLLLWRVLLWEHGCTRVSATGTYLAAGQIPRRDRNADPAPPRVWSPSLHRRQL